MATSLFFIKTSFVTKKEDNERQGGLCCVWGSPKIKIAFVLRFLDCVSEGRLQEIVLIYLDWEKVFKLGK